MSRFTDQQQVQTGLLTFLLLEETRPLENELLGVTAALALVVLPFLAIPAWIFGRINTWFVTSKAKQAILAELHLYESGQICNSYSHVEVAKLKQRLRELG